VFEFFLFQVTQQTCTQPIGDRFTVRGPWTPKLLKTGYSFLAGIKGYATFTPHNRLSYTQLLSVTVCIASVLSHFLQRNVYTRAAQNTFHYFTYPFT
jgi:hypothetical protein